MMSIPHFFAHYFPFIGPYKRKVKALIDTLLPPKSYSQHGEDMFIYEYLAKEKRLNGIYVDVGANHPSSISNTYFFYRKGFSGLVIEPHDELANLHRQFRRRDRVFEVGAGKESGIFEFNISKTPVLNSFQKIEGMNLWKTKYVPVLTLDIITRFAEPEQIFLLTIDTEGLNYQVIQGAEQTLAVTYLVCIEVDSPEEEALITEFLTRKHRFRKIKSMGCNRLFVNEAKL